MLKKMHPRFYSRVSHSSFKGECIFFVCCDYVVWPLCRTDFSAQRCSSGHDAAVERTAKQMTWLDWVKKDMWLLYFTQDAKCSKFLGCGQTRRHGCWSGWIVSIDSEGLPVARSYLFGFQVAVPSLLSTLPHLHDSFLYLFASFFYLRHFFLSH